MLLKVGDRVRIAPDTDLVVLRIRGRRVSLGFLAPAQIAILRGEVHAQGDQQKENPPPKLAAGG